MNDYISLVSLSSSVDHNEVFRLARHGCLDIHRVDWTRCFLSACGTRMLSCYRALDAESVRLVMRHQELAGASVRPALPFEDSLTDDREDDESIMVEVLRDDPGTRSPALDKDAMLAALQTANLEVLTCLASRDGALYGILVRAKDEAAIRDILGAWEAVRVWRCSEIDPTPGELFRELKPSATGAFGPHREPISPSRRVDTSGSIDHSNKVEFDAVVIGAGMSGISAMCELKEMGLRVQAYESGSDAGGVWHWNRYPGARVDSETYTYGFSFSRELVQDWDWQELFCAQPEIERYLQHVVDRFDLRPHIRFNTRVASAHFDSPHGRWIIETDAGNRIEAKYLLLAAGTLSTPQLPDYAGMDAFGGQSFHTAHWPASSVELTDKRVGVVGTGASGVQVIQTIAGQVRHLTVFQRTPTYCIPQRNRPLTDADRAQIRADWPRILAACRKSYGGFIHTFDKRSGLSVSAEERERIFDALWQTPGFAFWFGNFADLMMNMEVNSYASDFIRAKISERVTDPETARKLIPEHPFGSKRVPLENGYYEVYNRDNVELVDLKATPIEEVTESGIRTSVGEVPLDIIVYATGFDAGTGALTRIDIRGEDGIDLNRKWKDGPKTFLGLMVGGFPNLFIVNGPHNAAALCNAGRCIEQNVSWIGQCIRYLQARGLSRIVPAAAAEDRWTEHVYDAVNGTVLAHMTDSWFFGANTPGKPRRVTIYAPGAREYRRHCEQVARGGYVGCVIS